MTRRTATHRVSGRETQGAIDFDAALEGYACGYMEPEELLRAAGLVLGSCIPLDPEASAELTGCGCELVDYDDADRAVRRWLANMRSPARGIDQLDPQPADAG